MRYGKLAAHGALALALVSALAACGNDIVNKDKATETPAAESDGDASMDAATDTPSEAAPPAQARNEKVENDLYEFAYSYPAAAAAIPGLRDLLDKRLDAAKAEAQSAARQGKAEAQKDGFPFHAYARQTDWKVVVDLPRWLSLSAEHYEFSGGAHGMTTFDSLVWDKGAERAVKPVDLFTSPDALRGAIRAPFCDALDKERAKKRGEPVTRDNEMFNDCIDPTAQVLILGSSNKDTFDRIGLMVAPYEAGPYAEGSYEVTLPVTGKVMAALKPQYRGAFSVKQ